MKVKVKEKDNCQKILQIEVSPEHIKAGFDQYYDDLKRTAQVSGFRKGKAPREVLEQHFSQKASEHVLSHLISESYQKAAAQENIYPVDMPTISNVNFKNAELSFEAVVDVRPKFNLKNYKGIKIKKEPLLVKDEEIEKVISFLQERYAQFLPVEKRQTQMGDYVICDYSYAVEGKLIEKKEKVWLCIDEKSFIAGLSQQLIGIDLQERKEFEIELPDHFHPPELAKKKANFTFLIKEIKEKKLPALDDEFAKIIGKDTLAELRKQINEDLIKEKELKIKQDMHEQIIEQLVKAMPIFVPDSMVKKREQLLRQTTKNKLKQQGLSEENIAAEEKQLEDVFKTEALKQIRTFFILEEIAEQENIKVEEEEIDKRIELLAQAYNQKKEDIYKYLSEKKLLDNLRWEIWEDKVFSFLVENAKIVESEQIIAKK